ncbi:MAG: hypothetical protein IPN86_13180 [Saprospiraceae bacterium]|jgi:hypothetical protein|nr:hypothetical protein [Saprospiraceae bacterium]
MKSYLILLVSIVFLYGCPTPPCSPFNETYSWGPYTSNGDKSILEQHIKSYLDNAIPQSLCPAPGQNIAPEVKQVLACDIFPSPSPNVCILKEYIINYQAGMNAGENYPSTNILGCDLKNMLDAYLIQVKQLQSCCNGQYASIHPDFTVLCITTSNGGYSSNPVKRTIHINTVFRCCVQCT